MNRSRMLWIFGCAVLLIAAQAANAAGPWKVALWQAGVPTDQIQANAEFQIRGEGFHARVLPVKVCLFEQQCQLAEPDQAGDFMLSRIITQPGTYEIRVFQAKDMQISEWRLKTSCAVTVTQ